MPNEPLKTNITPNNISNNNTKLTFKYPIPKVNYIKVGEKGALYTS